MIRRMGGLLLAGLLGLVSGGASAQEPALQTWRLERGRLEASAGATDAPVAVGSLQKPFVARAWAQAHPDQPSPRFTCRGGRSCWFKRGHGELGLSAALARSCNAYFRQLAELTPLPTLAEHLGHVGFTPAPTGPDEAIGLAAPDLLRIRPSRLLEAYSELIREPWPLGEPVRQEVLRGLRDSARGGTATGVNAWGLWAKTGTVPLGETHTVGFAVALDGADTAMLARLRPGTGSQAAKALAAPLAAHRSGTPVPAHTGDLVTVRLFDLLPLTGFTVRNTGPEPIPDGRGFLGPGASRPLHAGDRVGPGSLEFRCESRGVRRRVQGRLQVSGGRLLVTLSHRDYVAGVLAAELPQGEPTLRLQLGAAVLRFLDRGPRHGDAEVCDSTHCAWFVGEGPRLAWVTPTRAREVDVPVGPLGEADWVRMQALAKAPGPFLWTGHCGGQPLSTQRVWGWGDAIAESCPRHASAPAAWTRTWGRADLAKAFGAGIEDVFLAPESAVWRLTVVQHGRRTSFGYDEAHRRIAAVLGWDALPSPASRVDRVGGDLRVSGVGQGHRVGLCLGR